MSDTRILDRAVYAAAWRVSAFGLRPECLRILRLWAKNGVPYESVVLVRAYVRDPTRCLELVR
jgi:hypothetical protein